MKNKIIQITSICLLLIFSVFTFGVNFSFSSKEQREAQIKAEIMEKEKKEIAKIVDTNNFVQSGTSYYIKTHYGFVQFMREVNNSTPFTGATVYLDIDIDLTKLVDDKGSRVTFVPIGNMTTSKTTYFKGTFDGQKHVIKNLSLESNSSTACGDLGLFGYAQGATIANLTLTVGTIKLSTSGKSAGAIAGSLSNGTIISNCVVLPAGSASKIYTSNTSEDVSMNIGGVVGYSSGYRPRIECCVNMVKLVNDCRGTVMVGGIIGHIASDSDTAGIYISNCYSDCSITAGTDSTSTVYCGGILGISKDSNLNLFGCINKSKFTVSAKNTGSSGSGGTETGQIREDSEENWSELYIDYAKKTGWNNATYSIQAGGIAGDAGGGTVQQNVNYTSSSNHSVLRNSWIDTFYYFYGRVGATTTGVTNSNSWYGDYVYVKLEQYLNNIQPIAFNKIGANNYSYSFDNMYSSKLSGSVSDRVFRAEVTNVSGKYLTSQEISLGSIFDIADTSKKYITYNTGEGTGSAVSVSMTLGYDKGGRPVKISQPATRYTDVYSYDKVYYDFGRDGVVDSWEYATVWHKADVFNFYSTSYQSYQLGINMVNVKNYNSITVIYQPTEFYGYMDGSGVLHATDYPTPHYEDKSSSNLSFSSGKASYTSYFNSRFVSSSNDLCPGWFHKDKWKGSNYMIKDNRISCTSDGDNFTIKHIYSYNYDSWTSVYTQENEENVLYDTLVDHKVANDANAINIANYNASQMSTVLENLGKSAWDLDSNGKPTLKWMEWIFNAVPPPTK